MRPLARTAFVALGALVALAASSCDNDELPRGLPIAETERARQLKLFVTPPVETISRSDYASASAASGQQTSDARIRYLHDTYGRIGFFPRDYDLRPVQGETSALFAAYYSSDTKKITLIGAPEEATVVHELVHALQDQHFDLTNVHAQAITTDEEAAKSALIEGDATIAEFRHVVWTRGEDPSYLGEVITQSEARRFARETLEKNEKLPPFFLAYPAFAYTYGASYAIRLTGARRGFLWIYGRVDQAFRDGRPKTTKAVLRADGNDEVVDVGLTRLPGTLAGLYALDAVDRLGAWYTHLLFYRLVDDVTLQSIVERWTGDQLVVVHRRDTRVGTPNGPSGTLWTSAWADLATTQFVMTQLMNLHGLERASEEPNPDAYRARDGEPVWLTRRDNTIAFVKNVPFEDARIFADRALSTPADQAKLPVQRQVLPGPRRFPCAALRAGRALLP